MIESLLEEIADRGWHVYSLHHCADSRPALHQWECTIRYSGPPAMVAFATGDSMATALAYAIDRMDRAELHTPAPIIAYDAPTVDLRALLNLQTPAINRRI